MFSHNVVPRPCLVMLMIHIHLSSEPIFPLGGAEMEVSKSLKISTVRSFICLKFCFLRFLCYDQWLPSARPPRKDPPRGDLRASVETMVLSRSHRLTMTSSIRRRRVSKVPSSILVPLQDDNSNVPPRILPMISSPHENDVL